MKIRNQKSGNRRKSEIGSASLQTGRNAYSDFGFRTVAFSLIEILVVVALLSVIILGLLAMFTQTQKAFRIGLTQTDVLMSGRLAGDMFGRELEQITPAYQPQRVKLVQTLNYNFYAQIPYDGNYDKPFLQPLPGGTMKRMNLIQDLFFISKRNQDWVAIGYFVRTNNSQNGNLGLSPLGVGTLYRFETNATALSGRTVSDMFNEFSLARNNEDLVINGRKVNRAIKLAEGVVHFKVRAFETNGAWIVTNRNFSIGANYNEYTPNQVGGEIERYEFWSNAVPAAVELELGILEDKAWQRFKALPTAAAQTKYLTDQVGRLHLFRQHVTIRNVDPVAYQ